MGESQRIRSLDGLRGVAALIVVIHHTFLTFPVLRAVYDDTRPIADTGSLAWWMIHTPLHLIWAGGEAVFVFFVLSGLVLTLPVIRAHAASAGGFAWRAYYPSRLARLYVPVWASIVFAIVLFVVVRLVSPEAGAAWVAERGTSLDPKGVLEAAIVLRNTYGFNGPLWSLLWEIIFSALLPAFIFLLARRKTSWWIKLVASFVVMIVGAALREPHPPVGNFLFYMAMFAVGVTIASDLALFRSYGERISARPRAGALWAGLIVLGALMIMSYWFVLLAALPVEAMNMLFPLQVAGATLIVFCVAFDPRVRSFFESRPVQWLGKISFSLYLVHDPIIEAINHLTGGDHQPLVIVLAIPTAILVAWGFFHAIERPSHRLARLISGKIPQRVLVSTDT